jgi:uncharacterized protein
MRGNGREGRAAIRILLLALKLKSHTFVNNLLAPSELHVARADPASEQAARPLEANLWAMNRSKFLGAVAAASAATAVPSRARAASDVPISLKTATGTIYGTLTLPTQTPAPVVLIVAGSGPTDRDGNSSLGVRGDTYKLLAQALEARGIATVRYDKRGVGASVLALKSENDLRFDIYVQDAASWVAILRDDSRFSSVTVAGHSEGSLVGMLALQNASGHGFASLAGAGRPAPAVLREQLAAQVPAKLYAQANAAITQLQQGHLVTDAPPELAVLLRPSVQPYLISWFKYDPAIEIAKLHGPIAIVQGAADVQVSMADARALARGAPKARFVVVDGMNHVLKYAPDTSTQAAILRGYDDPSLPIDPDVVRTIQALL